jgi:hypothetical protein
MVLDPTDSRATTSCCSRRNAWKLHIHPRRRLSAFGDLSLKLTCCKIDSSGLNIYNGAEWWNLKDKIQGILNNYGSLDGRMIVPETQIVLLEGEFYSIQGTLAYHS